MFSIANGGKMQKFLLTIMFLAVASTTTAFGSEYTAVESEKLYTNFIENIQNKGKVELKQNFACKLENCNAHVNLLLSALDELTRSQLIDSEQFIKAANVLELDYMNLQHLMDLYDLVLKFDLPGFQNKVEDRIQDLLVNSSETTIASTQLSKEFARFNGMIESGVDAKPENRIDAAKELFQSFPSSSHYSGGSYESGVKLFLFCRENRAYPCLMLMRDRNNKIVFNDNFETWSHTALAKSKFGSPYNKVNGNTPMGIFTIDGVMPSANRQDVFGKYRRLILNFVERSPNESTLKSLLPRSAASQDWWKQSVVARNNGRSNFRIHGTGIMSNDSQLPYHPLIPTSGCVAQRENSYGNKTYKDQRHLLDTMMRAQGLSVTRANEANLKGLLYIINIDNQKKAVTLKELRNLDFL